MSITSKTTPKSERSITQQSDIVIEADGTVHISFLWDDLRSLTGEVLPQLRPKTTWAIPDFSPDETILQEYKTCRLCPKSCGFPRLDVAHPSCGDFHFSISNIGLSFGDEPSIRGESGSGIIMLSGCPLRCPSCHNPEKVKEGKYASPLDFFEACRGLLERGAENIQILSPTVHLPILRVLLTALKKSAFPLPIVLKSSGYEKVNELKKLNGLVDIYLPDLKFGACSPWAQKAGAADYFETTKLAISEMIQQVGPLRLDKNGRALTGVLVRHVNAPLPPEEKKQIDIYLNNLPDGVGISRQNDFVCLE